MESKIEAAIAVIQQLSDSERQEVLRILSSEEIQQTESSQPINEASEAFWNGAELDDLLKKQAPVTVTDLEQIKADFWPEEDSLDDFLGFLKQQRQDSF